MEPIPFSSLELERRWTDLVEHARNAEKMATIIKTRELNKELKDAYNLIYKDHKWQVCMKIKDLWIWLVKEEELKSKNAEVSGETNVPQ